MSRRPALALLLALLALPLAFLARPTGDALALLPPDAELSRAVELLDDFDSGSVLLFDVDGRDTSPEALHAAVDALTRELTALPSVTQVRGGLSLDEALPLRERIAPYAAAYLSDEQLAELTSEAGMQAALQEQLARLMGPAGALVEASLLRDPLSLEERALRQLQAGQPDLQADDGLLLLAPGRALVLAELASNPSEVSPDDPLVDEVSALVAAAELPITWFGGHRVAHTTARAVKAEVHRAALLGLAGLFLVLVLGFRSPRPLLGALGPLTLTGLFLLAGMGLVSPVHGIVLGFVGLLGGLAVDYWVHLYLRAAQAPAASRAERLAAANTALAHLRRPLWLSGASTVAVLALLATSSSPLVHQLGLIGALALTGALLGTELLGPHLYAWLGRPHPTDDAPLAARPRTALGLLLTAAALALVARGVSFDADPSHLLSTPDKLVQAEAHFAQFGLGGPQALILLEGDDLLARAERVSQAVDAFGLGTVRSPHHLLPSPDAVARRRASLPPVDVLQARLDRAAEAVGFAPFPGAAERLIATLSAPPTTLWQGTPLQSQLDRSLRDDAVLLSLPLPQSDATPALRDAALAVDGGAVWHNPQQLTQHAIDDTARELLRTALLGGGAMVLLLLFGTGSVARTARALLPAATAIAASTGALVLTGTALNPVSVGVLVLVLGLSVDHGVFVSSSPTRHTRRAVLLGTLTTLAGGWSLLLTDSPALFGVGVVLVAGVGTSAATALLVLPALLTPSPGLRRAGRWAWGAVTAGLVFVLLDLLLVVSTSFRPHHAQLAPPEVTHTPGRWTSEDGERQWVHGVWLMRTHGDAYDSGQAMGAVTSDLRERLEEELFASFARQVSWSPARWIITRSSLLLGQSLEDHLRPEHMDQIQGVADAHTDPYWLSGSPYTRRVYYHAIHDLGQSYVDSPLLGCTGFAAGGAATADGHWLLARNFDFEGGVAFDRDKTIWVHQPEEGHAFLAVAFAGLVGAVSGVNEEGLAVAINAAGSSDPIRPGMPMTLIVRDILQHASSLDEAQALLDSQRGFVSENVLVVDGDAGEAALFEVTPNQVQRLDAGTWLAVSNHFRSDALADDPVNIERMEQITTVPRLERMEELVRRYEGRLDLPLAAELLRDQQGVGDAALPRGHRHAIDADIATHGVVFDATTRTAWVSRYPSLSGGMVEVRLDDALAGNLHGREVVPARPDARLTLDVKEGRELLRAARRQRPRRAEQTARQALALMPDHPEALYELGRALHAQGRHDDARPYLERALATPPEYEYQRADIVRLLETP